MSLIDISGAHVEHWLCALMTCVSVSFLVMVEINYYCHILKDALTTHAENGSFQDCIEGKVLVM